MNEPGEVLRQYEALRHGVGAYTLPCDVVAVAGRDATAYLQGQLSQDVAPLEIGTGAPGLLLEPDGKLTALVRVTRTAEHAYAIDTETGFGDLVTNRLQRFKLRTKVDIERLDWQCVALRGAGVDGAEVREVPPFAIGVDWNGVHGVDVRGPGADAAVPPDAVWCERDAWEALRIEAGIPQMGTELDARTIAAEAGLVERTVSFTKGCYTGQELVARLDARGSRVAKRLCGFVDGSLPAHAAQELVGTGLWAPESGKSVGRVTSAAWCPGLDAVAGLCFVHRSVEVPATLDCGAEDGDPTARRHVEARPLPLVV